MSARGGIDRDDGAWIVHSGLQTTGRGRPPGCTPGGGWPRSRCLALLRVGSAPSSCGPSSTTTRRTSRRSEADGGRAPVSRRRGQQAAPYLRDLRRGLQAARNASAAGVKLLTIAVNLGCAGLLFFIGGHLFGPPRRRVAALFFSVAAVTGVAEDFAAPNTEIYVEPVRARRTGAADRNLERPSRRALVAAGVLVGVASLYRLQGGAGLLAATSFFFASPPAFGRRSSSPRPGWSRFRPSDRLRHRHFVARGTWAISGCGRCATTSRMFAWAPPTSAGARWGASRCSDRRSCPVAGASPPGRPGCGPARPPEPRGADLVHLLAACSPIRWGHAFTATISCRWSPSWR